MSRTIATSGGLLLCVTGALLAVGFLPPVLFAQQSLPGAPIYLPLHAKWVKNSMLKEGPFKVSASVGPRVSPLTGILALQ